jgi:hypothetical protein
MIQASGACDKGYIIVLVNKRLGDCNGHTGDLKCNKTGVRLKEEPDALSIVT